jgi:meso-butanediol dehydrogenase / (S,S)-butanediol dehydrogenase / diacetyl reductase
MPERGSIVVTGGASGIGRAVCLAAHRAGLHPIVVDRDVERGTQVAESIGALFIACDLARLADDLDELPRRVEAHCHRVDGIVNAAGISSAGHYPDLALTDWETVMRVNLTAPFFLVQALDPLLKRPGAAIVNVTSAEAEGVYSVGERSTPAYAAAKAGLRSVTECLASDLAGDGIRVNAVAPGMIATPLSAGLRDRVDDHVSKLSPLGRWGEPEEIAEVVLFLLSDRSSYLTGASVAADGGLTLGITARTFGGA